MTDLVVDLAVDDYGDIAANLDARRFCTLWIGGLIHYAEPAAIAEELNGMRCPVPGTPGLEWSPSLVEAFDAELKRP
jgi:hypothetical protein